MMLLRCLAGATGVGGALLTYQHPTGGAAFKLDDYVAAAAKADDISHKYLQSFADAFAFFRAATHPKAIELDSPDLLLFAPTRHAALPNTIATRATLCRRGRSNQTQLIIGRISRELAKLESALERLQNQAFSSRTKNTSGLPTISDLMRRFGEEARTIYGYSLEAVNTCAELAASLPIAASQIQDRATIAGAALQTSLLHSDLYAKSLPSVPRASFHAEIGWKMPEILVALIATVTDLGLRTFRAVEIGVAGGHTSQVLLQRFPHLEYLGVDPYYDEAQAAVVARTYTHKEPVRYYSSSYIDQVHRIYARAGPRAKLWQMTSQSAHERFEETIDFVFIDGEHSYQAVQNDLNWWAPKVRSGGVVAGHDYFVLTPLVIQAVNEHVASRGLTLHLAPDLVWWFYVP